MRTTTAAFDTAKAKTGTAPVWLMEVYDEFGTLKERWSDKSVNDGSNDYDPYVVNWGDIVTSSGRVTGGGITEQVDLSVTHVSDATVKDSIKLGWRVKIYLWFDGESLGAADRLQMFDGVISSPILRTETSTKFTAQSRAAMTNAVVGRTLNDDDFPNVNEVHLGSPLPIVYGTVEKSLGVQIDSPIVTKLIADIDDTDTTLNVVDATRFSGSAQSIIIGNEVMLASKSSDTTLFVSNRGYAGTTAAHHVAGKDLIRPDSYTVTDGVPSYDLNTKYMIADHPIKTLDTVYINGVALDGAEYTMTEHADGYTYVETDNFLTTLKRVQKINGQRDDLSVDIDQDPTNAASFPMDVGSGAGWYTSGGNRRWRATATFGAIAMAKAAQTINATYGYSVQSSFFSSDGDYFRIIISDNGSPAVESIIYEAIQVSGSVVTSTGDASQFFADEYTTAWDLVYEHNRTSSQDSLITGRVRAMSRTYAEPPTIEDINAAVLDAVMMCDLDGKKDDASGTITGTANALIEEPADVIQSVLLDYGNGVVAADLDTSISSGTELTNPVAFVLPQQADLNEFCRQIAFQSFARFFWDGGKAYLKPYRHNRIPNGSFERWESSTIWNDPWTLNSATIAKASSFDGYAMKVTATSANGNVQAVISGFTVGQNVNLTYRYRVTSGDAMKVKLISGIANVETTKTDTAWTNAYINLSNIQDTSVTVRFYGLSNGDIIYIDYARLTHYDDSATTADVVFDTMEQTWTDAEGVVTAGTAFYKAKGDRGYTKAFYPLKDVTDDYTQSMHGVRDAGETFLLGMVQDQTTAEAVTESYLDAWGMPKEKITFQTPLSNADWQRGDVIRVTHAGLDIDSKCYELTGLTITQGDMEMPDLITVTGEQV